VGEDEMDEESDNDGGDGETNGGATGPLRPEDVEALRQLQGTELNFIGFGKLLGLWSGLAHPSA
jgi:hypothetical protein